MQCDDFDDEETDLELNLQDDLHALSPVEELDYWDAISPHEKNTYDGTRFYD